MAYLEMVKEDVKNYVEENEKYFDFSDYADADDFAEDLNDKLWIEDGVTGNASGSYTFNSEEAKKYVLEDVETVREALQEFCTPAETIADKFLNEDWEYFDVSARCWVLSQAIGEYIDENRDEIEEKIEAATEGEE